MPNSFTTTTAAGGGGDDEDITDDALEAAMLQNAAGPRCASGDSGSVEQHSLADQLALLKYRRSLEAAGSSATWGLRHHKLIPPGSD
jgi:hypothetical protein